MGEIKNERNSRKEPSEERVSRLQPDSSCAQSDDVAQIEKEQQVYDIVLQELIRQVYVECADRGILLDQVSQQYRSLFSRVPTLLSQMQEEIDSLLDANKSLRMLLEKLMEEKSTIGKSAAPNQIP